MSLIEQGSLNPESSLLNPLIASTVFDQIKPVDRDFAKFPIIDALTWRDYIRKAIDLKAGYLVVFRSKISETADREMLTKLDNAAEEEAREQKGFVGYFKGPINEETGENLSFCLWLSQEDAKHAASQSAHTTAAKIVKNRSIILTN